LLSFYIIKILTQNSPVHWSGNVLDAEAEEEERNNRSECMRIMLEAGADTSLEHDVGGSFRINTFIDAVKVSSVVIATTFNNLYVKLILTRPH
jgi:transcriptional antiterminator Rof (Rho-off)